MNDVATNATVCGMLSTPLWLQHINPYLQFVGVVLGSFWVLVQLYYKFKNGK